MSEENVETLVKHLWNLQAKRKTHMGEKQKLQKEMKKKYEGFDLVEIPASPRADLSIQEMKEYEGKIKLENKLIDLVCNRFLQKVKIIRQGLSTAFLSGTRSGSHKMVYRHFEVMKLIWGGSPNVEPVSFGIGNILKDLIASLTKK